MKITITQNDIALGQRWTVDRCPVAIAASRAAGWPAQVSRKGITFSDGSLRSWPLPTIALNAVISFDRTGTMQPFAFSIEEPLSCQASH